MFVKLGTLISPWTKVAAGASAISVAHDAVHGPVIGIIKGNGFYAKQGSVTGAFTKIVSGVTKIAVATDATNGPLLGMIKSNGFWAKQGTITAPWVQESIGAASAIAVATDATHGPLLGVIKSNGFFAKSGSLTAPWTQETIASANATRDLPGDRHHERPADRRHQVERLLGEAGLLDGRVDRADPCRAPPRSPSGAMPRTAHCSA